MTSTRTKIVIADCSQDGLHSLTDKLNLQFECIFEHVETSEALSTTLQNNTRQILVIDFDFPEVKKDLSFLRSLTKSYPDTAILPIIPAGDPELIKGLLQLELFYFIHKPLDPTETAIGLKRSYDTLSVKKNKITVTNTETDKPFHGMIGTSKPMRHLFELIEKVAEDDMSTVLIRGESGTGKEMVAKAIHAESVRKSKNFVPVNCAAIPDDLLESELFGYTKGAFTGANSNKPGRIQYADQGTLFLDEIGDMKSSLQAKLLRVLQEKEFEPVGSYKSIPVNTRIVAATHCDLEQLVSEGTFREDLYYRLSVIPLNIPSLKERKEDIPQLINGFLEKYAAKRQREPFTFSDQAMAAILHYEWRGNVRELENLVQHMAILYSGKQIEFEDLPEKIQNAEIPENYTLECVTKGLPEEEASPAHERPNADTVNWDDGKVDFKELINDFETQLIVQAMKLSGGNKKEAAKLLNLKRTTLLEKIKKKAIDGLWEE